VKPDPAQGGSTGTLNQFFQQLGRRLAIVQTFTAWQRTNGAPIPFPTQFASYAESLGATPMITWQPQQALTRADAPGGLLSNQPNFSLTQIASGTYDSYIRSFADQARQFGHPVLVRMMHEMNDKTYPWSYGVNGNTDPAQYVAAWQHIVNIFRQEGASNVQFVWCIGATPVLPNIAAFYPGDGYVSWVAIDGYNRGTPWKTFTDVFGPAYSQVTALTSLPVMIAEFGTVESPSDPSAKASWITSALQQEIPQTFPRVRAALYFDAPGRGFSYALSSSPAALSAYAQAAGSSSYQATTLP
jgi:hypothetical protein